MTTVFDAYARYYDLFYGDKDYEREAGFVDRIIRGHVDKPTSLLDLGCGTGRHARAFADRGYQVTGIDQSTEMIARAKSQQTDSPATDPDFHCGDVRHFRTERKFDAVTSLFHVVSYQTSNADLLATLATAKAHLAPGGVFVFDCWYGPAVLRDLPAVRHRCLDDGTHRVRRIAEPCLHPNENLVDVHYSVLVTDTRSGQCEELAETHHLRYLFLPELQAYLAMQDMTLLTCRRWLDDAEPGLDSWNVYCVAGHAP